MPGGDGTGPMGMGSMTGRGAGYCAGYPAPGYANFTPGRGMGFGFGRGLGRGRFWRRGGFNYWPARGYAQGSAPYYGNPNAAEFTPQQEADMLKKEVKLMQDEVTSINKRIKELESTDKDNK